MGPVIGVVAIGVIVLFFLRRNYVKRLSPPQPPNASYSALPDDFRGTASDTGLTVSIITKELTLTMVKFNVLLIIQIWLVLVINSCFNFNTSGFLTNS